MEAKLEGVGKVEYVDWRKQTANPKKHGGFTPAAITCVVEALENMVFLSNATNFVAYFIKSMHYTTAHAANMVTNFMATSFLLTVLGGFITDSFLNRFWTFILSCSIELLGITVLTIQAGNGGLKPAPKETPTAAQAAMLYCGLYAIAAGFGGIKASLAAHGADQLEHGKQAQISAYFNWFFFSLCVGGLMASTVMIWVQENLGWNWGFRLSFVALTLALCLFAIGFPVYRFKRPTGSPITRILKVLVCAIRNRETSVVINDGASENLQKKFRFLDKAMGDDGAITDPEQVEETRSFLRLLPIFGGTIMMNCCLAQLQTFSVEQGSIMDRNIRGFLIPTQSMTVFPLVVMIASIPFYEHFLKTFRGTVPARFDIYQQPLKRIGVGLALASVSMAVAAAVEHKRRTAEFQLSVFWLSWQYFFLGVADMLTLGGMLEFFYSEAPSSMRSMCTALAWASTSMGFFLSSVLVTLTNDVTGKFGTQWLGGHDLNRNRLDLFYGVLCILNSVNLVNYVFWAKRY